MPFANIPANRVAANSTFATYGLTAVPGTSNLLSPPAYVAKGVLLKKVASIEEARACGGVYVTDGTKFWFAVGKTADKFISLSKVGYHFKNASALPNKTLSKNKWLTATLPAYKTVASSPVRIGGRVHHGGVILRDRVLFDGFAEGTLYVCGVVTSATEGYGTNVLTGETQTGLLSYMRSHIPLTNTGLYYNRAMQSVVDSAPEEAREFLVSTAEAVLANHLASGYEPLYLTVNSIWRDGIRCGVLDSTLIGNTSPYAAFGGAESVRGLFNVTAYPQDAWYTDTFTEAMSGWLTLEGNRLVCTDNIPGQKVTVEGIDFYYNEINQTWVSVTQRPLYAGRVETVKLGDIMDSHAPLERLVNGVNSQLLTSSFSSLGEYVAACIPAVVVPQIPQSVTIDESNRAVMSVENYVDQLSRDTMFSSGNLVKDLSRLSTSWMTAAEAAATQ